MTALLSELRALVTLWRRFPSDFYSLRCADELEAIIARHEQPEFHKRSAQVSDIVFGEPVRVVSGGGCSSADASAGWIGEPAAAADRTDETAARGRLAKWLAAASGRSWDCDLPGEVTLTTYITTVATGVGPTLAEAIHDALDKAGAD